MITVEHLTKYYGSFLALDDVSFEIDEGHVYGFLGPNGAGKSTTMNIMTGCLSASSGHVRIDGHDIFEEPDKAKKLIGYLPEHPPLYMSESPRDYLRFVGEAKGLRRAELAAQIDDVMRKTGIEGVQNRRISDLSKGYRQRIGIAQALLGSPRVIILDEPTVGLDPLQIIEIRDLIRELGKTHTVIFSSHILSEVQTICDQILMIAKGKLVAFDTPENLEKRLRAPGGLSLTTDASPEDARALLENVPGVASLQTQNGAQGYTDVFVGADGGDIYALSRGVYLAFRDSGHVLYEMALKKGSLEDVFVELTEKDAAADDFEPAESVSAEEVFGTQEAADGGDDTKEEEDAE